MIMNPKASITEVLVWLYGTQSVPRSEHKSGKAKILGRKINHHLGTALEARRAGEA